MASSMPVGAATNSQVCSNLIFVSAEQQIVEERGRPVIPARLQGDLKKSVKSFCSAPRSDWQLPEIRFMRRKRLLFREAKPVRKIVSLASSSTPAPVAPKSDLGTNRWWTDNTTAVVTGGSKSSIGLEIVRKLSKEGVKVVFTSRSVKKGEEALEKLKAEGIHADFHELDITSPQSVDKFANWLEHKHGGLDILVNNAGVMIIAGIGQAVSYEDAKTTFDVNYYGTKRLTEKLLPLMKNIPAGARVVNVCSRMGVIKNLGPKLQPKISDPDLTLEELDSLVAKYLDDLKAGRPVADSWSKNAYANSKVAEAAYTRILARDIEEAAGGKPVLVNAVCPGFCRTDLGLPSSSKGFGAGLGSTFFRLARDVIAPKSAEEGADTPAWVALAPPNSSNGVFFSDRKDVGY